MRKIFKNQSDHDDVLTISNEDLQKIVDDALHLLKANSIVKIERRIN